MKTLTKFCSIILCLACFAQTVYGQDANRPFGAHQLNDVGLEIWVPQRPKWQLEVDSGRRSTPAAILSTPDNYYPETAIEIVLNKGMNVPGNQLEKTAESAIREIRVNSGLSGELDSRLNVARYGDIAGYSDQFDVDFQGQSYSMEVTVGRFSNGEVVTMLVTTPKGQLTHIDVMKKKIFRKLSLL